MTIDLQSYIERLKTEVESLPSGDVKSRSETRRLRDSANAIQVLCQHIFTEVKAVNRSLPG